MNEDKARKKLGVGVAITPVIPALRRWRQEDGKFEHSLVYIVR
jgi:hypothetical protein